MSINAVSRPPALKFGEQKSAKSGAVSQNTFSANTHTQKKHRASQKKHRASQKKHTQHAMACRVAAKSAQREVFNSTSLLAHQ